MSVGPMIEKLEKQNAKEKGTLGQHEEPTDSESEVDERWEPDAVQKRSDEFEKKCDVLHYQPFMPFLFFLETLDEAHNRMHKIDHFEQKHLQLPFEYTVIGEVYDSSKPNRAMRMVRWKEIYDPNNPLEEKLAALDHTFGKKGRVLEEEIKELAERENSLTEEKRRPLYRKGFDTRLVDMNRTCKVTKGGNFLKYTAMLVYGNYNGVIGFAKGKGTAAPIALQKCFQNLHYVERHEEHTITHAVQTEYKKTKVRVHAGKTVELVLNLAGFKNVKSKVVGSRNPHNTVKALFKALNAVNVQEKFGRAVVESHLL
ncbi:hypothetical protein MKW92_034898 [Papaver armeniacum]|nr:hypothetical protein MKW92_034898 [Papaver armeniacum]